MVDLLRAQVKHAMLGIGTVTQQDANYITVQFVNKTSRFAYPAAFETYLVPEDPNLEHAIRAEIDAAKAAETAREAAVHQFLPGREPGNTPRPGTLPWKPDRCHLRRKDQPADPGIHHQGNLIPGSALLRHLHPAAKGCPGRGQEPQAGQS